MENTTLGTLDEIGSSISIFTKNIKQANNTLPRRTWCIAIRMAEYIFKIGQESNKRRAFAAKVKKESYGSVLTH